MSRQNLLPIVPFVRLVLFTGLAFQAVALSADRPNIIFVLADDLGYSDLGSYGGEISTPTLDRMAEGGLRFTQFYNEAKCVESRTSLMTGMTHHSSRNLQDRSYPTIAELMSEAGYRTLMVGKWHLADTPTDRGFSRYFGFLNGAVNFWTGAPTRDDGTNFWRLDDQPFVVPDSGFYTTDDFTNRALEFISEAVSREKPFFLYLAYNAPHYPLHAWPEDIAKYLGKYSKGWDQVRADRLTRMKNLGILSEGASLSARDPLVPPWEALTPQEKEEYDLLMAVYAAMVDRLDQNIGRLMKSLEDLGIERNTLVFFASDNGGCPYQNEEKPDSIPGGPESHRTYNTPWANASNTPFRLYKRYSHEGGTSTPLIAYWPEGISRAGSIVDPVTHFVDVLPTCLELAGAKPPEEVLGESFLPVLKGRPFERSGELFWEYRNHRAVRQGDFKLVAESGRPWALYNVRKDRIESNDLSSLMPGKVEELAAAYDRWARESGAPTNREAIAAAPMNMKDYTKILGKRK